ncbi:MAG TPA: hypothetical protein DCE42_12605 [Myxococcales bacterium]|nr:hypothetical protein [Deltaproteobacteria bacterium]HAA55594.1 hypothetical protein [Myxococcales bacterium]|tara:strand:+ start:16104 stop:16952 length:849 start_codon:yes stop_codon:yes gene_type:complete
MSRVSNQQSQQPAVQNQKPPKDLSKNQNVQRKAGENAFANRLKGKNEQPKPKQQTLKQPTAKAGTDASTALLQKHGQMAMSRRGGKTTVADLQAKLEAFQGGEGKGAKLDGAAMGKGDKMLLGDGDNTLQGDLLGQQGQSGDMSQIAGQQMLGQNGIEAAQGTYQVQGAKIPTAMLDKMVEHARVGVNATGAPEFQFDLKGDVLGGLKMRMSMDNGQLKAIFVAENPEVRRLIDGNMQDLKKALEDRGIHIRDLEVRDPKEDQRQRQRDQHNKDREQAFSQD